MKSLRSGGIFVLAFALAACTTNPYTGEREVSNKAKGAGIGAAIGAVIGVLSGDDADERRKRALIGAVKRARGQFVPNAVQENGHPVYTLS